MNLEPTTPQYLKQIKKHIIPGTYRALHRSAVQAASELKQKEVLLIRALQEVDENLVYRYLGFSSLYQYCLQALKLTEGQSMTYISVARKSKHLPQLQEALNKGEVTVSKVSRVVSVMTPDNQTQWLDLVKTSTKYEIEKAVAKVNPRLISPEKTKFLTDTLMQLEVPITEAAFKDLKRVQDLLSQKTKKHVSLEEVITYLSKDYLKRQDPVEREARRVKRKAVNQFKKEDLLSERQNENKSSCPGTINQNKIKRSSIDKALTRDQSRCVADTPNGRCSETRWLQVHHVIHQEHGGGHELHNLQTLCAGHHREMHGH